MPVGIYDDHVRGSIGRLRGYQPEEWQILTRLMAGHVVADPVENQCKSKGRKQVALILRIPLKL